MNPKIPPDKLKREITNKIMENRKMGELELKHLKSINYGGIDYMMVSLRALIRVHLEKAITLAYAEGVKSQLNKTGGKNENK